MLSIGVAETIEDAGRAGAAAVVATLRRDDAGLARLLAAFAEVHALGGRVDWRACLLAARRVDLPTYPFQRRRFLARARRLSHPGREDRAGWRYQVAWRPVRDAGAPALGGRWHLVAPPGREDDPLVRDAADALAQHGAAVTSNT